MEQFGIFDFNEENKPDYIYCVPDVHGDSSVLEHILVDLTKVALYKTEYNDKKKDDCKIIELEWNPEKTNIMIIFLGDLVDMKRSITTDYMEDCDFQILETLFKLQKQAKGYNSRLIILLGNHEIMNFQGNFAYVPSFAITEQRTSYFKIGSEFAKKIAKNTYLTVRINNIIMVHGGFCKKFMKEMRNTNGFKGLINIKEEVIPQLNKLTYKYLSGTLDNETQNNIEQYIFGGTAEDEASIYGPLWCRDQSLHNKCNLHSISKYLNVPKYKSDSIIYIIAHTPQLIKGINSICNDQIWCIDIGMSRAFEENPISMNNLKINSILEKSNTRAMSVLKITSNDIKYVSPRDFEIITEGILSRNFVRNKLAVLKDSLKTSHLYTTYFNNNKKKLKEAIPVIKKLVKEYKKLNYQYYN